MRENYWPITSKSVSNDSTSSGLEIYVLDSDSGSCFWIQKMNFLNFLAILWLSPYLQRGMYICEVYVKFSYIGNANKMLSYDKTDLNVSFSLLQSSILLHTCSIPAQCFTFFVNIYNYTCIIHVFVFFRQNQIWPMIILAEISTKLFLLPIS